MGGTRGSDTEEDICNGCEGKEEAMEADTAGRQRRDEEEGPVVCKRNRILFSKGRIITQRAAIVVCEAYSMSCSLCALPSALFLSIVNHRARPNA
jgi:hypothetical protein